MRSALLMTLMAVMLNTAESDCTAEVGFYHLETGDIETYNSRPESFFLKVANQDLEKGVQNNRNLRIKKKTLIVVGAMIGLVGFCVATAGAGCVFAAEAVAIEGLEVLETTSLLEMEAANAYDAVALNVAEFGAVSFLDEVTLSEEAEDGLRGLDFIATRDRAYAWGAWDFAQIGVRKLNRDFAQIGKTRELEVVNGKTGGKNACELVSDTDTKVTIKFITQEIQSSSRSQDPGSKTTIIIGNGNGRFRGIGNSTDLDSSSDATMESAASGRVGISSGLVGHVLLALTGLCIAF